LYNIPFAVSLSNAAVIRYPNRCRVSIQKSSHTQGTNMGHTTYATMWFFLYTIHKKTHFSYNADPLTKCKDI